MPKTKSEMLDPAIDAHLLQLVGAVTFVWSLAESQISAVLFSLLKLDPFKFGIRVRGMDIERKLTKIQQILEHKNDSSRSAYLLSLNTTVRDLRPTRNAITHGVYQGKTKQGEYCFGLSEELLLDEEKGTAFKMRVFTTTIILDHVKSVMSIIDGLPRQFDAAKMSEAHAVQFRVPTLWQVDPEITIVTGQAGSRPKPRRRSTSYIEPSGHT